MTKVVLAILCILLLTGFVKCLLPSVYDSSVKDPFVVVWNSQTANCKSKFNIDVNVTKYGIIENSGYDDWKGYVITLLGQTLGEWPMIHQDGQLQNGGIPQVRDGPS